MALFIHQTQHVLLVLFQLRSLSLKNGGSQGGCQHPSGSGSQYPDPGLCSAGDHLWAVAVEAGICHLSGARCVVRCVELVRAPCLRLAMHTGLPSSACACPGGRSCASRPGSRCSVADESVVGVVSSGCVRVQARTCSAAAMGASTCSRRSREAMTRCARGRLRPQTRHEVPLY